MLIDHLDRAYWTLYRYLQPIDRRYLGRRLLRLRTPPRIEEAAVSIKSGVGRGLTWRHRDGYSHCFWTGTYDFQMQAAMKRLIRPGHVVYDIGGNAGFHALLLARLVGPGGKVYCFEPLPENIAMIQAQLAVNDLPWCEIVPAAVSDQVGTAELFPGTTNAVASLLSTHAASQTGVHVPTTTLDTFASEHAPPAAIKMDIEGAEGMALAGARDMLARWARPVFFLELHGPACRDAVADTLLEHRYRFESLSGRPLPRATIPARGQVVALP